MHDSLPEALQQSLLADLIAVTPQIPTPLVDKEGLAKITEIISRFPVDFSNFWGLEVRLHKEEPLADILFQIKRDTYGQRLLAGLEREESELSALCSKYPFWAELREFVRAWSATDGLLHRHLLNMWLEFDTEALLPGQSAEELLAQPSVFLGFRSHEMNPSERSDFLTQISSLLPFPSSLMANLLPFLDGIPAPGQMFQLGAMLGRPTGDLRVCVNQLEPDQIPSWLSDLGWSGDGQALSQLLMQLSKATRNFAIDLNLTTSGPSPKIGIECYLQKPEELFLELLQEITPCSSKKCQALLAYPGTTNLPLSRWKSRDGAQQYLLNRYIHHIKLGVQGDQVTDAKAYLAIHRPGFHAQGDWYID